ncbi:YqaA family protein [Fulvivirga sediminis]|uniref:VTT domain-containing protein n=1 Tax=Fulvivirga sediminis TaxID=2803949 RepID=A0A937FAQ5_9BACT|nr:VTT domain-containing protein [Fulvivirga sediminis]MBL3657734.1 VTT domain-containing protein [Fulvivirga sediminis]
MPKLSYESRFLIKNLVRGLLVLGLIIVAYIVLQKHTDFQEFLDYIGQWPFIVYMVYTISEVVFGIIPPELFMIWSINSGLFDSYVLNVAFLAAISYGAGVLGYFVGRRFKGTELFDRFLAKHVNQYHNLFRRFGGFLIFIGAVTPIPFSAVCMLVGMTRFKFGRFLLIATTRFLRFAVYSYIIYQAQI